MESSHRNRRALLGAALALALTFASPALATAPYMLEKIALDGEPAPDSGGQTYTAIDGFTVDLNAGGDIAFGATLSGPLPAWGVFAHTNGVTDGRAISGAAAPAPLSGTYLAFGYPYIDDGGEVSFGAMVRTSPTTSIDAVIAAGASSSSVLVIEGDAAPPAGSSFDVGLGELAFHSRGPAGVPIFQSTLTGGAHASGIFAGPSVAVALAGDPSPVGGSYDSFHFPGGNAAGTVAFPAFLNGAAVVSGLFVDSGSGPVAIALEGDVDPNGETLASMLLPQVNSSGEVMFSAEWLPLVDEKGAVYVHGPGGLRTVIRTDEPMPGTGGATIVAMTGLPHFSNDGRVTLSASLTGGDFDAGVFVIEANGSVRVVAKSGEPVPGVPGASFVEFGHAAGNDAGQVAFAAVTSDTDTGVFLASAPMLAVPALSPVGLASVGALMLGIGAALARRKTR